MVRQKKASSKRKGRAKSVSNGTDEKQSARFVEMARALGVKDNGGKFSELFTSLVPAKKR